MNDHPQPLPAGLQSQEEIQKIVAVSTWAACWAMHSLSHHDAVPWLTGELCDHNNLAAAAQPPSGLMQDSGSLGCRRECSWRARLTAVTIKGTAFHLPQQGSSSTWWGLDRIP
jgi:hypothetical protein